MPMIRRYLALPPSLRRFAAAERAATAVEFALVAPIFIALVLAALQVAMIFLAQSYLDEVAERTAREVLTNQSYGMSQQQFRAALCKNVTTLFSCDNIIVALEPAPTNAAAVAAAAPQFDASGKLKTTPPLVTSLQRSTTALLIVEYEWPIVAGPLGDVFGTLGNGAKLLTSTHVFQTEP